MPRLTRDVLPGADDDDVLDTYVVRRAFTFNGRLFSPGEPITVGVYRHNRFDTFVSTLYVKAVA